MNRLRLGVLEPAFDLVRRRTDLVVLGDAFKRAESQRRKDDENRQRDEHFDQRETGSSRKRSLRGMTGRPIHQFPPDR